ncbi:uncharacterized protein N0V89_001326 [Didymosphaeria variabile]|uniref:Major facilitator superfamily (MFS) profile domain-containing protein n=1 Tax=Didymosphaeria variabile TaxID=1932322 RepID=A0A9W8XW22_9PLEO|nr:uncharacterized protein N0V89_001326 [Didymosphaeria variabile]KAJ4360759.1 hypothetical protein N0V89_001326 [Didymosphaeria variabile]
MTIGTVASLGQLIAYMSASMIAPALGDIERELHTDVATVQVEMLVTFLGFGLGPFVFAVLAEAFGRRPVWMIGNIWFILWNAIAPLGSSTALMIFARLMAGIGASVGINLAFPIMADMFREEERGKSMAIVSLLTYAGPALGPILGGVVTQLLRWQWIFWILSILNTIVTIIGVFLLEETYTPVLLRRKHAAQTSTAVSSTFPLWKPWESMRSAHEQANLTEVFLRPIRLYWTRPIIYFMAGLLALDMVAIGATINGQFGSWLMDRLYARLTRRNNGVGKPEFRIPYLVPGLILMPAGLLWYGWSAHYTLHWVMVDFGVAVFTMGSFTTAQAVNAYQLGEFSEHSASAMAASCLLQNVIGFVLPIFAPQMYKALGYGWGNSLVALIMLCVGLPMAGVLWYYGERIRKVGRKV